MINTYDPDDLICALATPWAESAIGVIRISGPGAVDALVPLFSRPDSLHKAEGYTMVYGMIRNPDSGEILDEVMAGIFRAPRSYTGQEGVELYCHGSLPGLRKILDLLIRSGCRNAQPGEFTFRAFLNGKMDLTRAEAVHEIITARSGRAQTMALHRLGGRVESVINNLKEKVVRLNAQVEIQLDYPEDEVDDLPVTEASVTEIRNGIKTLLETYRAGQILQEGVRVVLAGPTNAGKSSLFNLFVKEDRSIVSEIHGTTRDYLESWISLSGVPVRLYDTAGLRDADHPVEMEGIRRSEEMIENGHIILYLVDAIEGITPEVTTFIDRYRGDDRLLLLWTKVDAVETPTPEGFLPVSAEKGTGFHPLEERILQKIFKDQPLLDNEPVIDSLRQKKLLEEADIALVHTLDGLRDSTPLDLISLDLAEALRALGEITGEVTTDDILETMFSGFCVGK